MIYLLDTQLILWAAADSNRLSDAARTLLADDANEFLFSAAAIWEITIKSTLGRSDFSVDARLLRRGLITNGAHELPITSDHALAVSDLPPLHKDPFDRIQVAQAREEGIVLLTADQMVAAYGAPVELV
ncbi:MAG: type II toxin-antitoxin system VapC family toxin [Actinobacteria bacterium]|nr:type II toxin-antitoxin system VapC family toxin [Actinomycetota bacterium]